MAGEADDRSTEQYFPILVEILKRIIGSLNPEDVLAYLTESVAKAMDGKAASVRLLDESGTKLEMRAVYGLSEAYLNKGPVELQRSAVDRHILDGNVTQLEDVSHDPNFQYPGEAHSEGIVSVLSAPLIAHDRPIGVLRVYAGTRRRFSSVECGFIQTVAELAALAIHNASLHQRLKSDHSELIDIFLPAR
ncbi:MAG TPA: GAF domain-containing protein [Chloroflexota bacterium]|nr:GAF domain-containing protein [Chloroflexota bacterium]